MVKIVRNVLCGIRLPKQNKEYSVDVVLLRAVISGTHYVSEQIVTVQIRVFSLV